MTDVRSSGPSSVGARPSRLAALTEGPARRLSTLPLWGIRLVAIVGLSIGAVEASHATTADRRLVLILLLVLALAGFLGWVAMARLGRWPLLAAGAFVVLAIAGGALGAFSGLGVAFVVVLGIAAGDYFDERVAIGLVLVSLASLTVSIAVLGAPWVVLGWASLAGAGGLMAGMNRRGFRLRAEQSEELLRAREGEETEAAHAAALAERNRIAREVHDVLAHSLSALAVQLEALDALLAEGDLEGAERTVATARRLAVEGLEETRRAVHALREPPVALAAQVAALAADSATFRLDGTEQPLPAESGMALYRAAQEALTNARKHAPGARVSVVLSYLPDRAVLSVLDEYSSGAPSRLPAAAAGGGFGLRGMRERVELLGGNVRAGPLPPGAAEGWRVEVQVPLHENGSGPP